MISTRHLEDGLGRGGGEIDQVRTLAGWRRRSAGALTGVNAATAHGA
jgi:hypothetical protein